MKRSSHKKGVAVVWKKGPVKGTIEVVNGKLASLRIGGGRGKADGNRFAIDTNGPARLVLGIAGARLAPGAHPTMVTVRTEKSPFTFFLRDVHREFCIYIPDYEVAVVRAEDHRDYDAVAEDIHSKGLLGGIEQIESEPEETYENACRRNWNQYCHTWLGLSRDMRMFRVGRMPKNVQTLLDEVFVDPCYHSIPQVLPETDKNPLLIQYCAGPGISCRADNTRRLEEGILPILHEIQREDDVTYHHTAFATLETRPLTEKNLRGSAWQAVYPNTYGHMLTPEEVSKLRGLMETEMRGREEEVVCCLRVEAVNAGRVPRYAWFRGLHGYPVRTHAHQRETGFSVMGADRVYGINRLNGRPMPEEEMAVLLQPGETAVLEMLVPHQPISAARAGKLARLDFEKRLEACRQFWRSKLAGAASISVPEPAIDERIKAGLLHCDLVALGREPDGTVLATIGWYSPIGSESAPIIQFFDSMGWHKLAERSLQFFLDRQRADGFMQNFGGYQLETGPALWTMGEHYRYTRDDAWVRRIKPNLLKACDYLLQWRERNKRPEFRGRGYGLLDGKVADPEDFFHSFMLNGVSYLGIQRTAEMLARVAPAESKRLAGEAAAFRKDIRVAFYESLSRSPVVPLGDGTWVPSAPPWAEYRGPVSLYAEGGDWYTHGSFSCRDSLAGALYLVLGEVLDPNEIAAGFLLKSNQELFTVANAGLSQPYYCRHDFVHLKRGEVKAFLKTYYNQMTALQDRETYTFWEHYYHASQHKTHEEGWFLMQTRWMLYLEEGDTLAFLRAIPRRWLEDGKRIEIANAASYFGPVSLRVESDLSHAMIHARITCQTSRWPKTVTIRLPHPEGRKAAAVTGGRYDPATETVRVAPFKGTAEVTLHF